MFDNIKYVSVVVKDGKEVEYTSNSLGELLKSMYGNTHAFFTETELQGISLVGYIDTDGRYTIKLNDVFELKPENLVKAAPNDRISAVDSSSNI